MFWAWFSPISEPHKLVFMWLHLRLQLENWSKATCTTLHSRLSSPDQQPVQVWGLTGTISLHSWAAHFTLSVCFSVSGVKWVTTRWTCTIWSSTNTYSTKWKISTGLQAIRPKCKSKVLGYNYVKIQKSVDLDLKLLDSLTYNAYSLKKTKESQTERKEW